MIIKPAHRAAIAALLALLAIAPLTGASSASAQDAAIKGLGRFAGWRENALIGYGLVVGLAGSGDSPRSAVTRQALSNVFARLGAQVSEAELSARNVAVVIVVASLPASANVGDALPVTISSAADARSLAGGTLLMTPLLGPDGQAYALAQGPLITGGDSFESQLNLRQRNYPTTARLERGAIVEASVEANLLGADGNLVFLLDDPNFTTATRIASAINEHFAGEIAVAEGADEVRIRFQDAEPNLPRFIASIENLAVRPDRRPRVVVNERTGTIVAGGDVTISSVVISQGDIRVSVTSENYGSQPSFIGGFASDIRSLVITNTNLEVDRTGNNVVASFPNTTVADLVEGLAAADVDTRRVISILQAMRAAGALHAEIIVQ